MVFDPEALSRGIQSRFPATTDEFLQEIALLANDEDPQGEGVVSIILMTGGTTITGMVTSGRAYFEAMARSFAPQPGNDFYRQALAHLADQFASDYPKAREPGQPREEAEEAPSPAYLHLKEAKVRVQGQPGMPVAGMWWRVKVADVSGFALGSFDPPVVR